MKAIVRVRSFVVLLIVTVACCMCLAGCADSKEEAAGGQEAQQQAEVVVEEVDGSDIPDLWFVDSETNNNYETTYFLVNQYDERVPFADEAWEPCGPCKEGVVFVTWQTSKYDEEWDKEYDVVDHYGLVDTTGNLAVDLTDLINDFFVTDVDVDHAQFENGVLALGGQNVKDRTNKAIAAINHDGEFIYTIGKKDCSIPFDVYNGAVINDRILEVESGGASILLEAATGKVLAQSAKNEKPFISYGYGYMAQGYSGKASSVTDYDGNVLFELSSVEVKNDIENARMKPLGEGGIVVIMAEKVNPYGGKNKDLCGVYSVPEKKWLVPLSDGVREKGVEARDGLLKVYGDSKALVLDGYGAEDEDEIDGYTCLMDFEGKIVLDEDSEELAQAAEEANMSSYTFFPEHLESNFWRIAKEDRTDRSLIAYIVDGEVVSIQVIDFDI